jgi:hypothetical protein
MKTEDDVIAIMLVVLGINTTKIKCNTTIHRIIRTHFGCTPDTVAAVWNKLIETCKLVRNARIHHLLWMLAYFKSYNEYEHYLKMFKCSKPTFMSWIWYIAKLVSELEIVSKNHFSTLLHY